MGSKLGWITFRIRSEEDLKHALWLMRLSYLRYGLKTAASETEILAGCRDVPASEREALL
jgi:hypothetical protein